MPKAKKRKRSILAPILALLLVLALAGALLFSTFRDKIERWEYPQRYHRSTSVLRREIRHRPDDFIRLHPHREQF